MKRMYKIIALILTLGFLLSTTVFATTYVEDDYIELKPGIIPGDINVVLKADIPEVDSYETLLPELDIARIDRISHYDDGRIHLRIVLTEWTEQASLDAIEALKSNNYVDTSSTVGTGYNGLDNSPIIALKGDLNNDDAVTNEDIVRMAQFIVYSPDNRAYRLWAGDMNQDGLITNSDLVLMARMVVGLD